LACSSADEFSLTILGVIMVRLGDPADWDSAIAVWRATTLKRGRPVGPEDEARVQAYASKRDAFLVIADARGKVVGMAVGMQGLDDNGTGPPISGLCHIPLVYVLPDRWNQGIGGEILLALLKEAHSRGYNRVQLWTHVDNTDAQRFYERHGFSHTGRQQDDRLDGRLKHFEREL